MMRKAGILLLAALTVCCPSAPAPALAANPEYVLSLNLPIPPIHTRWAGPLKAWADEIEKRSQGRLKIEPYFAEALSPRSEAFESVKAGLADITECAYEANSGQFPFHEGILSIASPRISLPVSTPLLKDMYAKFPAVLQELDGVKLLFTHASPSLYIGTTKKAVRSLDDLKGLKINANSAMIAERLKRLGVTVVSLPLSDLYTAMEQGVIDGTSVATEILISRRYGDPVKHLTLISLQNTLFYCVMNADVYNSLPDDLRAVVDEVSGDFADKAFADYWQSSDRRYMQEWLRDMAGESVNVLSDADYARAAELMQPPVDAWFDAMSARFGLPAGALNKEYYEQESRYGEPWGDSELYKAYLEFRK